MKSRLYPFFEDWSPKNLLNAIWLLPCHSTNNKNLMVLELFYDVLLWLPCREFFPFLQHWLISCDWLQIKINVGIKKVNLDFYDKNYQWLWVHLTMHSSRLIKWMSGVTYNIQLSRQGNLLWPKKRSEVEGKRLLMFGALVHPEILGNSLSIG